MVRYRIDGVLREANKLPRKVLGALVSRIKILSDLKIDEHRAPQDGRFKIEVAGITLRAARVYPACGGRGKSGHAYLKRILKASYL